MTGVPRSHCSCCREPEPPAELMTHVDGRRLCILCAWNQPRLTTACCGRLVDHPLLPSAFARCSAHNQVWCLPGTPGACHAAPEHAMLHQRCLQSRVARADGTLWGRCARAVIALPCAAQPRRAAHRHKVMAVLRMSTRSRTASRGT